MLISKKSLLALLPFFLQSSAQTAGVSTRYWDCCKPSCSWTKKISLASGATPVVSCDKNDGPLSDFDAKSGCDGGGAYMCTNQTPWAVSDSLAYGFAAVSIAGGTEASWCCACYELTFTSGPVSGKKMIVQATNTGGDLGSNHFDIAMPGGGFGIFNGCTAEFGTPSTGWGAQYGGISTRSQCDAFAANLKPGCYWRFDWFLNADNPNLTYKQVTCPAVLTSKTGCVRAGEVPTGGGTATSATTSKSTTAAAQVTTSATPTTTKASTPTTTSKAASGGTALHWGQCGGQGWTGPTVCESPYTCQASNPYWSQCL